MKKASGKKEEVIKEVWAHTSCARYRARYLGAQEVFAMFGREIGNIVVASFVLFLFCFVCIVANCSALFLFCFTCVVVNCFALLLFCFVCVIANCSALFLFCFV